MPNDPARAGRGPQNPNAAPTAAGQGWTGGRIIAERGDTVLVAVSERDGYIASLTAGRRYPVTLIAAITGRGYWGEREHDAELLERIEGFPLVGRA